MYDKIFIEGSDKMKKFDIAILLQFKQNELNELIEFKNNLQDKEILSLSKEIDNLQLFLMQ